MADDFPVGDFTPGTKERPERWRWVDLGPAPCGWVRARAYCRLVLVCQEDVPEGARSAPGSTGSPVGLLCNVRTSTETVHVMSLRFSPGLGLEITILMTQVCISFDCHTWEGQ